MKRFKFHNCNMEISQAGYGQYNIKGLGVQIHCTESFIWDWCDDESNKKKCHEARRRAYKLVKSQSEFAKNVQLTHE